MTPDELRLRQALILYGATPQAFQTIMSIAEDIRRTAFSAGRAQREDELVMAWSFSETGYLQ